MEIKSIDSNSFNNEVLKSDCMTIVIFFADWAGTCQILYDTLNEIINEYENIIKITQVNIEENTKLTQKLNIKSVPTMLFYKEAKLIDSAYGALPKPLIREKINRAIS